MVAAPVLVFLLASDPAALPEGNVFIRGLAERQRQREEALNGYTYDLEEVEEKLDGQGRPQKQDTRRYEVFHVKGRPVRRLVAENDEPLDPGHQEKVDERVRQRVEFLRGGRVTPEEREMRLSQVLDRYDFRALAREEVDGRAAIMLEFVPRPGKRDLRHDNVLRALAGRIWVDEADQELARAEIRNTSKIKFALGLGASVRSVELNLKFHRHDDGAWLPERAQVTAAGRILLLKGFRERTTSSFSRFHRFRVETEERIGP
jgi:hypothetical protein